MKRTTTLLALALVCLLIGGDSADAGLFRSRAKARQVYRYSVQGCTGTTCPARPTSIMTMPAPIGPTTSAAPVSTEASAFLAALNAWRAQHGRGPVGWDARLASFAAANTGQHAPGSTGGASQCWAGTGSLLTALAMWERSGPHASILLSARAVGASRCPSGATCNAM